MRAGLPVIASSVGGIPFVIKDKINGYLVRPGDVKGLFRVLLEVVRKGRKNRLIIENANNVFHTEFTCKIMASAYTQLYNGLFF